MGYTDILIKRWKAEDNGYKMLSDLYFLSKMLLVNDTEMLCKGIVPLLQI